MRQSGIANGDVYPCRFVKLDTTADGKILQCGAGDAPIGISQMDTRRSTYVDTSGKAAATGEPIGYWDSSTDDRVVLLQAGAAFTRGDRLKADSNGKGITVSGDGDQYGAVARASATAADQLVPVEFIKGERAQ